MCLVLGLLASHRFLPTFWLMDHNAPGEREVRGLSRIPHPAIRLTIPQI
jgi:hypothetical protein